MTNLEITQPHPEFPGGTQIKVNGIDLSHDLSTATVVIEPGGNVRATLETRIVNVARLCSPDAEVILDPGLTDALVSMGWTPPAIIGEVSA